MAKLNEEEIKKNLTPEDFERIYNNTMQNSIGEEKQCDYNKKTKKVTLRIALTTLTLILVTSCFINIIFPKIKDNFDNVLYARDEQHLELEYNGYSINSIRTYEKRRFYSLMRENGLTDYSQVDKKRDYHYTVEDYIKMEDLDESYLYAIYISTVNINDFLIALGYTDLQDFLLKNNYVNEQGKPSVKTWRIETAKDISEMMLNELRGR